MTEPVKRYRLVDEFCDVEPDPNGQWCRYEPRFDDAPQLSREEVELIEESWMQSSGILGDKLHQLITRLRAQPQASPWVPCSERMPDDYEEVHFWAFGHPMTDGYWLPGMYVCEDERVYRSLKGNPISFTPTHWSPIIRPEPPGVG